MARAVSLPLRPRAIVEIVVPVHNEEPDLEDSIRTPVPPPEREVLVVLEDHDRGQCVVGSDVADRHMASAPVSLGFSPSRTMPPIVG